jgi:hypothetical protein
MLCTKHNHSTEASARRCAAKDMARRADRRLRDVQPMVPRVVTYPGGRSTKRGTVALTVYSEDLNTPY